MVGHLSVIAVQLAGRSAVRYAQTPCKSGFVTVAQPGSALTASLKAAA
jgi:hypothetical protein